MKTQIERIKQRSLHGTLGGLAGGAVSGVSTVFFTQHFFRSLVALSLGCAVGAVFGSLLGIVWAFQERTHCRDSLERVELFTLNASSQLIVTIFLFLANQSEFADQINMEKSAVCGVIGALSVGFFNEYNRRNCNVTARIACDDQEGCVIQCVPYNV